MNIAWCNDVFYTISIRKFMNEFSLEWKNMITQLNINQAQLIEGERLRPQIAFWGYLATRNYNEVCNEDFTKIAQASVSIELLHKASLLFDDWYDDDNARHGKVAFHTEYGPKITVATGLHMVAVAIRNIQDLFQNNNIPSIHYRQCIDNIIEIIFAMSKGAMSELQMVGKDFFDKTKIELISQLETSVIISNSFTLGYEIGNDFLESQAALIIQHIGYQCGYIFQVMNDLEALGNKMNNKSYKGETNYDIDRNRKNIAVAILFELSSKKERDQLLSANKSQFVKLANKYNLLSFILQDIDRIIASILDNISSLREYGLETCWIVSFSNFIKYIHEIALYRIKGVPSY